MVWECGKKKADLGRPAGEGEKREARERLAKRLPGGEQPRITAQEWKMRARSA
jgi:hypothetical protein